MALGDEGAQTFRMHDFAFTFDSQVHPFALILRSSNEFNNHPSLFMQTLLPFSVPQMLVARTSDTELSFLDPRTGAVMRNSLQVDATSRFRLIPFGVISYYARMHVFVHSTLDLQLTSSVADDDHEEGREVEARGEG